MKLYIETSKVIDFIYIILSVMMTSRGEFIFSDGRVLKVRKDEHMIRRYYWGDKEYSLSGWIETWIRANSEEIKK